MDTSMSMEPDAPYPDFTSPDEMSSVTFIIEGNKIYAHREILAAWSPVFRAMFTQDFREKEAREIELPEKKMDGFIELLHCIYPPIKPISDENVNTLLPLAEEYQIIEIKRKCEEYLLTKPGSMELLIIAQRYGLLNLLAKCIDFARRKPWMELQHDCSFASLESENLIQILTLRVSDLETKMSSLKKALSERDARLFGCLNEIVSGYGGFCTDCKSRKVNDTCINCMKMYREKIKHKCEEAKALRKVVDFD